MKAAIVSALFALVCHACDACRLPPPPAPTSPPIGEGEGEGEGEGAPIDTQTDPNNCGRDGDVCTGGVCALGMCVKVTP